LAKLVIYLGWLKDQRRCLQDVIMDPNSELSSRMVRIYIDYTTLTSSSKLTSKGPQLSCPFVRVQNT